MFARRAAACLAWVPLLILGSYALYSVGYLAEPTWHPNWDGGIYLLTARNIATGHGYTYLDAPFFLKPPGFAFFLSWFISAVGEVNFATLNRLDMGLAMAALLPVYLVMCRFHHKIVALSIALLVGSSPLFVSNFNRLLSEFLFLLLSMWGLWFVLPLKRGVPDPLWRGWFGTLLIAGSLYVRVVGGVLVPGLLIASCWRTTLARKLHGVGQVVCIVLLLIPWLQFSTQAAVQAPRPATQLWTFTYTTAIFHTNPGDPGAPYVPFSEWPQRIRSNGTKLIKDIGHKLLHVSHRLATVTLSLAIGVGFLLACQRHGAILVWLAVAYTAVIVTYFTYDPRLLLPLVPLWYSYLFLAVEKLATWVQERYQQQYVCLLAYGVVSATLLSLNLGALGHNALYAETVAVIRQARDRLAAAWVATHTPPQARILYSSAPALAALTNRQVYSYLYLRNTPLPEVDYLVLTGKTLDFEPYFQNNNLGFWLLSENTHGIDINVRIYRVR